MEKNLEGIDRSLEKIIETAATIKDSFPNSKSIIVIELPFIEYEYVRANIQKNEKRSDQFKIQSEGVEIIFMNESYQKPEEVKPAPKLSFWQKLVSTIGGKSSIKGS